jgi:hypothetical protein
MRQGALQALSTEQWKAIATDDLIALDGETQWAAMATDRPSSAYERAVVCDGRR